MKRLTLMFTALGIVGLAIVGIAAAQEAEEKLPAGHQAFLDLKCNMCHSVPAAGIEAKTKSEKMKGADLLAGEWDKDGLVQYIKQESEVDGEKHKKEFKGSDEELQALVDWLLEQKADG